MRGHENAGRHIIVGSEYRGGPPRKREQLTAGAQPGLEHEVPRLHIAGLERDSMGLQGGPVAAQPLSARVVSRMTGDEADSVMSEIDQMLGHLTGGARVVHVHVG